MENEKRRILHITYGFNGGGVGFVIANYCAEQPMSGVEFDIVGDDIGKKHLLHERFERAGFRVFYATPKKVSLRKNIIEMLQIIRQGHYDAVHVHLEEWSFLYLWLAKICGVKVRVCHSHMAYMTGAATKPHYKLFRFLLNRFATLRIACSADAGQHLFGNHPFTILNNAIEAEQYVFDPARRKQMRDELGLSGKLVIGTVGRLSFQKNPQFNVEIFQEIHENRLEAVLMFVGQGELEEEVRTLVRDKGLERNVLFLGLRTDVPDLLQAMDVFVLPSRFEGLGIVYVEAQAAGLKTFATAKVVPQEACISDTLFTYLPKDASAKQWAEAILVADTDHRVNTLSLIQSRGYDISIERQQLYNKYMDAFGGKHEIISQ